MKQTKLLSLLLALCILLSSFVACAKPASATPDNNAGTEDAASTTVVYKPEVGNSNPLTSEQRQFLGVKYNEPLSIMNGESEQSRPQPIVLRWTRTQGDKMPTECAVISADKDFTNPIRIESKNGKVELFNLELGETFYWYVEGTNGSQTVTSETSKVTVSTTAPRTLYVDGVTNCRDLGGWKTLDGKTLKQGQIFRTGRLSTIKSDGKDVLLNKIGIKTEIDLRNAGQVKEAGDSTEESRLGSSVKLVYAPMEYENLGSGNNILTAPVNKESLLRVFEVFGDENNYPILFHCKIGTDRTGMIAFLILGLCGVSEETLYRDFLFSGFGIINKTPEVGRLTGFLNTVNAASGNTLAEKIENYLLGRDVTAEQIATIKKMMR